MDWFHDDRGEVLGAYLDFDLLDRPGGGFLAAQAVAQRVGASHAVDLWRERTERLLVRVGFRGQRHCERGATVVGVIECDDGGLARSGAGDLDGVLNGFCTRVQQYGAGWARDRGELVEFFSNLNIRLVWGHHEARVGEVRDRFLDRGHDLRVRCTHGGHGDAGAEVDEAVTVNVFDDAAVGADSVGCHGPADTGGYRCALSFS